MRSERNVPGGLGMLLLALLAGEDRYGYEMIEALRRRSNHVFDLKAGTLYPLLHTLEREGWVKQSGKMRIIAPLLWKDILELLEIREEIDMIGFNLAIQKCTQEDFDHLHGIVQEIMDINAKDRTSYYNIMVLDTSFHRYINRKSGNSILINFSEEINEKVTRASVLSMKYSGKDATVFAQEHLVILHAMETGDYSKASELLSEHYEVWRGRMLALPKWIGFDPTKLDTQIQEEFVKIDK